MLLYFKTKTCIQIEHSNIKLIFITYLIVLGRFYKLVFITHLYSFANGNLATTDADVSVARVNHGKLSGRNALYRVVTVDMESP